MAVYLGLLEPGDTVLSLRLDHGGHLTHGLKVNFSGPAVHDRPLRRLPRDGRRRGGRGARARARAPAEAHPLRRLGVPAHRRHGDVPADRRRGRRAPLVRHGALRRARRRRAAPEPGRGLRRRHLDDAQDARRPPRRAHPVPRGARDGDRPRHLPGAAGRPARARDRGEGDVLPDRRAARGSGAYQRQVRANADVARARRCSPAGSTSSPAAPTRTCSSSTSARRSGRARTRRSGCTPSASRRTATPSRSTSGRRPIASGVRVGSQAATMRGFDEDDFREVGRIIVDALARRRRPRRRCARARRRSATRDRCTRASAATRPTSREG